LLRAALGDDEIPVEIEGVMKWNSRADVAEIFQKGRIFLAGDSAHVMPPYGGFGGNTGVQDAHNLAWKLAMVVKGRAETGLLNTYEVERRPAGVFTTEQAYGRYVTREAKYLGLENLQPLENDLNIELGYCYHSSAVIPDAVAIGGQGHENPQDSKGRPGTRAPHVWVGQEGKQISTMDLFGSNFVLLAGAEGGAWCDAAHAVSKQMATPIDTYQYDLGTAYGLMPQGAVLVRPDGFVAWRAKGSSPDPAGRLFEALRSVLDRVN